MEIATLEEKLPEIANVNQTLCERGIALAGNIKDRATLDEAVAHGKEIDRRLSWWLDFIEPIVSTAHKAWKTTTERRESVAAPLRRAKVSLSSAIGFYKTQEERKRAAAEEKLRAEMRKQAEDAKINTAVAMEAAGQNGAAEAVLDAPVVMPAVVLPKQTDTEGTYTRTNWKFAIVDESKIPREFMIPDLKKIGGIVRSAKKDAEKMIPGIEVQEEKTEVFQS